MGRWHNVSVVPLLCLFERFACPCRLFKQCSTTDVCIRYIAGAYMSACCIVPLFAARVAAPPGTKGWRLAAVRGAESYTINIRGPVADWTRTRVMSGDNPTCQRQRNVQESLGDKDLETIEVMQPHKCLLPIEEPCRVNCVPNSKEIAAFRSAGFFS